MSTFAALGFLSSFFCPLIGNVDGGTGIPSSSSEDRRSGLPASRLPSSFARLKLFRCARRRDALERVDMREWRAGPRRGDLEVDESSESWRKPTALGARGGIGGCSGMVEDTWSPHLDARGSQWLADNLAAPNL